MTQLTRRQKREEARRLFLTGECDSNTEIAHQVRTKPHTIGRWRKEEGWDELRLRVDRQAAEKLVESLAGERTSLNLRHHRFWDAILAEVGETLKADAGHSIRDLERLSHIIDQTQRGQRLARGLSLTGETEEQIRAQANAEARGLVDTFIEAIKENVADEEARDRIRLAVLDRLPRLDSSDPAAGESAQ